MNIAGIQKMTLVDFPGHVAATVFTRGCSFRCGFCHNPELVVPDQFIELLDNQQLFDFLKKRYGKLSGLCITGGEPCMQPDIAEFISHMKALGFDVKLDTNGSFPDRLEKIIKDGDVDYIAMDVKTALDKYPDVVFGQGSGVRGQENKLQTPNSKLQTDIMRSIKLIMDSGIDYEFRTTVCHPLHDLADFEQIGEMIKGAKKYYLQNFVHTKQINDQDIYTSFTDEELEAAQKIMKKYVDESKIR